ncbi:hypothetical protein RO3G_09091 [Rhizopus delemar RA 99-880]|uniref:Uncharacterized protein n=1 Tax=Rhizopus delemar (strain RA 99-880 / ATCC MYA-4621 / FGSC 9543 / NRRL 43880) TaxID=246409 RepID=I1C7F1_RHIO9|nr:hypothetical protein RO3G_09091 [Rhizopus delemar RA 99-880]|eukprot:EIE84381.1 hypothetical protein RO3G_09091 [Rhizopus delemar RA 99-880]
MTLIKLLYTIAQGNLDQIMGEETEKLEAVKNICDISEIQLQKRQRRKYCNAIETTPVEETPPLVYLNKKRPASALEPDNKELNIELYEFVQRFKSGKTDRTNWKKCFEQGVMF